MLKILITLTKRKCQPMTDLKKTIIYSRVSTNKQDVSIDLQKEKCQQYCQMHDLDNIYLLEDSGASGKSFNRPSMKVALDMIDRSEVSSFVVYKLDRLSRSMLDLSSFVDVLKKKNVELKVVVENVDTGSASGMLFYNILGSMAQFERETISNRIKDALAHKKKSMQKYSGIPPYGYDCINGQLMKNVKEEALIRNVIQWKTLNGYSFRKITKMLNDNGYFTKTGKKWTIRTLSHIYYKETKKPA